jgi:hypothetical protein
MKTKAEIRAEAVAVSDDQTAEQSWNWLVPGAWVYIICPDPAYFGQLVAITPTHYFLREASWVCETGRAHEFVQDPEKVCTEAEYLGECAIERPVINVVRTAGKGPIKTR